MMTRTVKIGEHKLPFILYRPASAGTKYLVVCIHGRDEAGPADGSTIYKVEKYGYPMHAKNGVDFPFAIMAPQVPGWTHLDMVSLINYVGMQYGFTHVFVTGLSAGGEMTWKMLDKSSTLGPKIVGIAPVASKWSGGISIASTLKDVPVFVHHNHDDSVMPWAKERGGEELLVEALNSVPNRLNQIVYKWIYPGNSHDSWTKAYSLEGDLLNYLKQTMCDVQPEPEPEPVKDDIISIYELGDKLILESKTGRKFSVPFTELE